MLTGARAAPGAAAADDFAAPVDEVGKAAVLDEAVPAERAVGRESSNAADNAGDGIGPGDLVETAADGVSEIDGGDDE